MESAAEQQGSELRDQRKDRKTREATRERDRERDRERERERECVCMFEGGSLSLLRSPPFVSLQVGCCVLCVKGRERERERELENKKQKKKKRRGTCRLVLLTIFLLRSVAAALAA